MRTSITTPRMTLTIEVGEEGGRHDPWQFCEYTLSRPGKRDWILHQGLGCTLKWGTMKPIFAQTLDEGKEFEELFWDMVGVPEKVIDRALMRLRKGYYGEPDRMGEPDIYV